VPLCPCFERDTPCLEPACKRVPIDEHAVGPNKAVGALRLGPGSADETRGTGDRPEGECGGKD